MNFLLWSIPLGIFVAAIVVGFLLAPYYIHKEQEKKHDVIESELKQIKDARPLIVYKGKEIVRVRFSEITTNGHISSSIFPNPKTGDYFARNDEHTEIVGEPVFLHALFANDPEPGKGSDAHNVRVEIEFYNAERTVLAIPQMAGRWAETDQPGTLDYKAITNDEITMSANGRPYKLDIVMKYDEDDECYGHNNETPSKAQSDFRDKDKKLGIGRYAVLIRVRGSNGLVEPFWFHLVNSGKGKPIEFTPIH